MGLLYNTFTFLTPILYTCLSGSETFILVVFCVWIYQCYMLSPKARFKVGNMEPIWGRQGPGGPHVGPMNFAIWDPTS